ncbi:iron complex outermembrane receptor protein [Nitrospirillum pindoramense]|uniref:Iron complex outermembrane receptor protein n=2 Tax=Nitrospirillum amazonense TaxID=28077 RepID=A0A560GYI4_9PROT|nr:iron complex outermembrane receptor protein [Nitrospirillum amazonense]
MAMSAPLALAVGWSGFAHAQEAAADQPVDVITITAAKTRSLEQFTPTASRLGLSARETPATLDVIDSDQMIGRGFATVEQAADSLPGVTSGGSPGDPSSFAMRGFTGDQITVLRNGLYIGPSDMTNRPQNTFNLASVEILKGPASVLYGQGAIGGVVNVVNKGPSFGTPEVDLLATVGSFGTTNLGVGGTTHVGDKLAVRLDVSRTGTDGYVHGAGANSTNATASLVWRPAETWEIQLTLDYLQDNPSTYFGTPLVPASFATRPLKGVVSASDGQTLDQRMRYVNYNVSDARIHGEQTWPQLLVKWTPRSDLTFENFAYYFHADRRWIDAETYQFNSATRLIDRDRFFVFHKQDLVGDQGSVTYQGDLFSLPNKVVAGFDYNHLDFDRTRGFPDGDSVDPFNPDPGLFGALKGKHSPTKWDDASAFFEDVLDVTPALKLVTGGRFDVLDLDRKNYNFDGSYSAATSFTRTYRSGTWRVGAVYTIQDVITPYVSFTTGQDPVGSNIFVANASENFGLSRSHQVEVGVKANTPDHRADATLSLYDILRQNILVQTGVDVLSAAGSQRSKGVELAGNLRLTDHWTISANTAFTDTHYGYFVDTNTGLDDSGKQPANIPKWTANLWTSVSEIGGLPLEIGGGLRYIGKRYANAANTVSLDSYTLVDIYASYRLSPGVMLTGRINNLFDKAYAQWADIYYPSEVMLGAPRSAEVGIVAKF